MPADEWIDFAVSVGIRRRNAARLVAFYLENAQCDYDFQAWVLSYVDPTGEEATRRALADQVAGSLP